MILEKISKPGAVLSSCDLSAEQKRELIRQMSEYEATSAYVYDRFFKEGFKEWELIGTETIMKKFLSLHHLELTDYMDAHNITDLNVLITHIGNNEALFNTVIRSVRGPKSQFIKYISGYGMGANTACCFGRKEHKLYNKIGILNIVEKFEKSIGIYIAPATSPTSKLSKAQTSPLAQIQKREGKIKGVVSRVPIEVYIQLVALKETSNDRSLTISELGTRALIEYVQKYRPSVL